MNNAPCFHFLVFCSGSVADFIHICDNYSIVTASYDLHSANKATARDMNKSVTCI